MLWWLLQNTIVAAVLAAGVLLVCRWRRIGPAGRHLLWLVVLVKLVTPPLVSWPWPVPRSDERISWRAGRRQPPEASGRLRSRLASDRNSDKESASPDNGAVVRSETFVVTLPAKKRGKAEPSERPAAIPPQESDPDAEPLQATPPWWRQVSVTFWLLVVWASGSTLYLLLQLVRIRRMSSRLRTAEASPARLEAEIRRWAEQLHVAPPKTRVVSGFSSPFLWACGRVRLIWPAQLADESHLDAWRGVVVHELAHLKRRDHWVGWLELVAGCMWWWNPLFWYVRSQLRENAELACDAWVVEALPGGRRQYAEALLAVCEHISRPQVSAVAIGVGGARRTLERRLTMILKDRVPFRVSRGLLCAAGVLALLILPGWAQPAKDAGDSSGNPQKTRDIPSKATKPDPTADPVRNITNDPVRSNRPTPAKAETRSGKVIGPEDSVIRKKSNAEPRVTTPSRPTLFDSNPATDPGSRVRRLEKQIQDLQRKIRALRGVPRDENPLSRRSVGTQPTMPVPVDTRGPSGTGGTTPAVSRNAVSGISEGVVATRTITLQRTTYRLPASRANALEAFLKLNIKAEVLQIELGKQPVRTPGAVGPMGPLGGGRFGPATGNPMPSGGYAPRSVPVITITTTPDVQKTIGAIIALMRKDEVPRDEPKADVEPGTTTPRPARRFGPPRVGPSPGRIPGLSSGTGGVPSLNPAGTPSAFDPDKPSRRKR
jgi:beta-lactamase regulating signal transducer with metallopeptidase domain